MRKLIATAVAGLVLAGGLSLGVPDPASAADARKATTLTVGPYLLDTELIGGLHFFRMLADLDVVGVGITQGEAVRFSVNGKTICTAIINDTMSRGFCHAPLGMALEMLLGTVRADYLGNASLRPSSAVVPAIGPRLPSPPFPI